MQLKFSRSSYNFTKNVKEYVPPDFKKYDKNQFLNVNDTEITIPDIISQYKISINNELRNFAVFDGETTHNPPKITTANKAAVRIFKLGLSKVLTSNGFNNNNNNKSKNSLHIFKLDTKRANEKGKRNFF